MAKHPESARGEVTMSLQDYLEVTDNQINYFHSMVVDRDWYDTVTKYLESKKLIVVTTVQERKMKVMTEAEYKTFQKKH